MRLPALSRLALALGLCSTAACYHAVVETGRPAGATVVNKPWVSTFVFGLVPAQDINVASQCPGGITKVETQQTFVNGLVGILTIGLYTPQSATITCAATRTGSTSIPSALPVVSAKGASVEARTDAVNAAAEQAAASHSAVLVRL